MSPTALALVVGAALLHATWNALAKRGGDALSFLWWSFSLGTLLLSPLAILEIGQRGLPASAWPFLAGTISVHGVYFYALGRSYGAADFSLVYPVARGFGVALVPILGFFLLHERLSPLGVAGVALVTVGIVVLHLTSVRAQLGAVSSRLDAGTWCRLDAGTWWALLTGLAIGAYSLIDKAGVARLHPVPYIVILGAGANLLLLPVILRRRERVRLEWIENRTSILVAAAINLTAYLLVLFAFRLSKAAYVVAARELSIVLSTVIGSVWLAEGRLGSRLLGAAVILAGVICVALAR